MPSETHKFRSIRIPNALAQGNKATAGPVSRLGPALSPKCRTTATLTYNANPRMWRPMRSRSGKFMRRVRSGLLAFHASGDARYSVKAASLFRSRRRFQQHNGAMKLQEPPWPAVNARTLTAALVSIPIRSSEGRCATGETMRSPLPWKPMKPRSNR
jgi:hypothetical protein